MAGIIDRVIESPVPDVFAGMRIDLYLSRRFSYLSRTTWQKEIESGRVYLNGIVQKNVKKRLCARDLVGYIAQDIQEPEVDFSYSVLFEDDRFLVLNKSGNIPVHPSGIFFNNTLVMHLERERGVKFYPVHRLDRETSGAILFGKDPAAASAVQSCFDRVTKEYLAVVRGTPEKREFSVELPLGPALNSRIRKKREAYPGAPESAVTRFKSVSSGVGVSLVKASPVTGRMHQIRVHLQYAGYPILGDKIYSYDESIYLDYVENGNTENVISRAGFNRCALHSSSLIFFHPFTENNITVRAALLPDMEDLLQRCSLTIPLNPPKGDFKKGNEH
jgi:RluA family pseudouridine synthase